MQLYDKNLKSILENMECNRVCSLLAEPATAPALLVQDYVKGTHVSSEMTRVKRSLNTRVTALRRKE